MAHDDTERQPKRAEADEAAEPVVRCPFCQSTEVELMSRFGSQLSTDQYYCRACHTPFERFSRD